MASRYSIEMDLKQAKKQANKLDDIANNISDLSNRKFENTLQNLSSSWKGGNASAYLNKGTKLQGQMNSTASELHSIASDIRRIAQRIYDAEMAALEIAENRTY
jgi:WXG100 family type VII secretion target